MPHLAEAIHNQFQLILHSQVLHTNFENYMSSIKLSQNAGCLLIGEKHTEQEDFPYSSDDNHIPNSH